MARRHDPPRDRTSKTKAWARFRAQHHVSVFNTFLSVTVGDTHVEVETSETLDVVVEDDKKHHDE